MARSVGEASDSRLPSFRVRLEGSRLRLPRAIGHVARANKLAGLRRVLFAERDCQLEETPVHR